jgi:Tfp pilus assembly protein PilO
MKIRTLSNREKKIAMVCVVMAAVYLGSQFFKQSLMQRDQQLLKKMTDEKQILDNNLKMIREAKAIEQKYKIYVETFTQKGSDEQEMSGMMSDIETAANKYNVQITNMQSSRAVAKENYKEMGIQIAVSAPLLSIVQFIHELQDRPYFYNIGQAQLEKSFGSADGTVIGRMTLTKALFK